MLSGQVLYTTVCLQKWGQSRLYHWTLTFPKHLFIYLLGWYTGITNPLYYLCPCLTPTRTLLWPSCKICTGPSSIHVGRAAYISTTVSKEYHPRIQYSVKVCVHSCTDLDWGHRENALYARLSVQSWGAVPDSSQQREQLDMVKILDDPGWSCTTVSMVHAWNRWDSTGCHNNSLRGFQITKVFMHVCGG